MTTTTNEQTDEEAHNSQNLICQQLRYSSQNDNSDPSAPSTYAHNGHDGVRTVTAPDVLEENIPLNDELTSFDKQPGNELVDIPATELRVYKKRFYILALFSLASILQVIVWNTWAPIAQTTFLVLGWNQADIALLSMWGGIISVIFCIPFAGIMDKYGIRAMFLLAETFALVGVAIRCIPVKEENIKWTANVGQFFIALAGPFLVQGPPLISAAWFPPHQRTTATAVASTSMGFGIAMSFIIGPLMISDFNTVNMTLMLNQTNNMDKYKQITDYADVSFKQRAIDEIYRILYIECGVLALLYVVAWVYFPDKPRHPPSVSASRRREAFLPGAKKLIRSINSFWLPALAFSISMGISGTWATQLVIMFEGTVGLNQDTVSWIAFYTYIGGVIGAFTTSRYVDYLGGRMKPVLLALITPAIVVFVWFLLICYKVVRFNMPSLYISTITYGFILKSTKPVYLEMICEGMYPVAEGITNGTLNWMSNAIGLMYLFVMTIPNIGVLWMNWVVLASVISAFLLLAVFREKSKRLEDDKTIQKKDNPTLLSKNGYLSGVTGQKKTSVSS